MSSTSHITVIPAEPVGTINPLLHGHFAEHLGELIYPGIYVDPSGPVPNAAGIRNDVVKALRPLGIPVLRWPGGCFADTYHWQDGVGPVSSRKKRVNVHWGMADEPNLFGTHEFMAFCRAIGAEPYFAANLGSAPPSETNDWIEYCNFAGTSDLARQRRANGQDAPYGIKYWGIGNENWGCGGNMTPDQYAGEYSRYQSFAFSYPGADIVKVACGPNGANWDWTERFFAALQAKGQVGSVGAFAAHYYAATAGTATVYTDSQWLELLARGAAVDGIISGHREIMDRFDPDRKVALYLDEWGTWHPVETGKPAGGLYQQSTIRDACLAALTLDTFNNSADKIVMANIAQLINVLQSLLLVDGEHCIKTPTYHVFDLYRPHKGATALRVDVQSDVATYGEASEGTCASCYRDGEFPGLRRVQGSASMQGKAACITLVNSHPSEPAEVVCEVKDARIAKANVSTLSTGDIHDHNTSEHPDKVKPGATRVVDAADGVIRAALSPASVTRFLAELG